MKKYERITIFSFALLLLAHNETSSKTWIIWIKLILYTIHQCRIFRRQLAEMELKYICSYAVKIFYTVAELRPLLALLLDCDHMADKRPMQLQGPLSLALETHVVAFLAFRLLTSRPILTTEKPNYKVNVEEYNYLPSKNSSRRKYSLNFFIYVMTVIHQECEMSSSHWMSDTKIPWRRILCLENSMEQRT